MKPWRRIEPTEGGRVFLPKECVEFLLNLPIIYNVKIMSGGVDFSKILELFGSSSEAEGTTSIQGFKRGSFWDLTVTKNTLGEPNKISQCGKPVPILTDAENSIAVFVMTVDGHPIDGVLTGMWR